MSRKDEEIDLKNFKILDLIPKEIAVISSDYSIKYLNITLEKRIGKNKKNLKCYEAFYAEDKPCSWCKISELEENEILKFEIKNPLNDNFYKIEEKKISEDTILSVFQEITEERESREKYKTIFEKNPYPITLSDLHGIYIDVNRAFLEKSGYSREEVIGNTAKDLKIWFNDEDRIRFVKLLNKNKKIKNFKTIFVNKNKNLIYANASAQIITHKNKPHLLFFSEETTNIKQKEKTIIEQKSLLENIYNSSNMVIFSLNPQYEYLSFNNKHKEIMKAIWGKDIQIGQDMLKIIGDSKDRKKAKINFDRALKGTSFSVIEEYGDKKLQRNFYENIYSPLIDQNNNIIGLTVFIIDITKDKKLELELTKKNKQIEHTIKDLEKIKTELQQTNEELIASEEELQQANEELIASNEELIAEKELNESLFNSTPAYIVGMDRDFTILTINKTMLKKLGYSIEETYSKNFVKTFIPQEERDRFKKILLSEGPTSKIEIPTIAKDNSKKILEWHISFQKNINDEVEFIFGIGIDITQRKEIETQLIQSQKMETVGILAGGLAHDFNNFLAGIIGPISIVKGKLEKGETIETEKIKKFNKLVGDSATRASELVQQLLSLSRKKESVFAMVDLNIVIQNVLNLLKNSLDKSIAVEKNILPEPAISYIDQNQIEQILLNICINAAHAMTIMRKEDSNWGGKLIISLKSFYPDNESTKTQEKYSEKNYWEISIRDTGVGMPEEIISQIFDPFFTKKEKGHGTGLGLSMAYNILQNHKGFIKVSSTENVGSEFKIYIPQKKIATKNNNKNKRTKTNQISNKGATIFIIDDEEVIRLTASEILSDFGYNTLVAKDGEEGIKIFKEKFQRIDLVLLDMSMPKLSGKETYIELKKINPNLKVLLSSGFKEDERVKNLIDMGIDGFLQKPYMAEKLAEKVNEILESK